MSKSMLKKASKRSNSSLSLLLFLMLANVDEMEEKKRTSVINKNNKTTQVKIMKYRSILIV
ncbi:hypothetical protein WwAna1772 [Wolbachia endosymbiont of Drosophila ananassae]|nr:hypothetical protein WwAna1772 [Wolbachia endosymbiont of Drosophila ananassae]